MTGIKRVVIEDYPAGNLPDEVRGGIDPAHRVRVTVEEATKTIEPSFMRYWGAASHLGTTTEEAVARIRALRDEWD